MLENIGHILYHVLIVIFPILVFYFLAILKNIYSSKTHKGKLLGMVIIILLLTMSFPVSYANGFVYDFRLIPIIVAFIYIGMIPGILTIIIMLFYLNFLVELDKWIFIINYAIITVIFYYLRKKFKLLSLKKKLLSISVVYW
ncbi:LytS/YhcK type 5TM receptor domain-containing protein, partial [Robertmurraya sp. Marseille-Q9965]